MQKRLAPLVVTGLTLGALPFLWLGCGQAQKTAKPSADGPSSVAKLARPSEETFHKSVQPFIETYCVKCHGGKEPEAELDLSSVKAVSAITSDPTRWNMVLERVRDKEMPPDDAEKIPTDAQRETVVAWLEAAKAFETQRMAGDPGIVLARRLSNAEYDYTIRDLTGVDIRPTKEFPVDPANAAGFDNTGESLAMSPALVTKYLEAARNVADHVLFMPEGLGFAPFPVATEVDRDKYATKRIIEFYQKQGATIATRYETYLSQSLEYADYFAAAWRFRHRAALGRESASLADFAKEANISKKYLTTLWATLNTPAGDIGPMAVLQSRWKSLPEPSSGKEPEQVREGCVKLREFIVSLRTTVRMKFPNPVPVDNIVASGSQTMVIWKDHQFANNRTTYPANTLTLDLSKFVEQDPAMAIPTAPEDRTRYEESFKRFCAVFPDAFVVAERGRMFRPNSQDDLNGHRYLSAGFHSQTGYFRDDKPLYDLVLDAEGQRELDRLWAEFDFVTEAPFRQMKGFVWFETAEPPSLMLDPVFADFRTAGDSLLGEAKLKRFAEVYYNHVKNTRAAIRAPGQGRGGRGGGAGIPLTYRAPSPGVPLEIPEGFVEYKLDETALQAIRDYFTEMNSRIRALEKDRVAAEPRQVEALVAFAERASHQPLTKADKDGVLAFYTSLRKQNLSHEDAIRDSIVAVLMSPSFTYRVDLPKVAKATPSTAVQPLSDYELANRLSYFLWSSMPDSELLAHAKAGDLHQPAVLKAQAKRMLQDAKIRGLATEFGGNWLNIRRFEEHNAVDRERFPVFTNELREAMFEEPVRYFVDLVQHNRPILDFIYGTHTFVNPVLAKHYGIPVPETAEANKWIRIDGADKYERGGLLPMAAFLTKNAPGLRTSPVKRGHWVVTRLLGQRIPAPPPNVPVLPVDESQLGDLSLRQMLAKHREDKSCASCHNKFDSYGLVFEGFGPVGEVRKTDLAGRPAETTAVFPDGSEGAGLAGLKTYFHTKVEHEFVDNFCRKILSYALGRTLLPSDDLVVKSMREKLAANGNRFDSIVEEIVTSRQFLTKRNSPDPKEGS